MTKLAAALLFLGLNYYVYHYMARDAYMPPRSSFAEFPLEIDAWSCREQGELEDRVWKQLGATDILLCDYVRRDPRSIVSVYVGYHASQVREEGGGAKENSIHPPAHCLPGSGWDIIDNKTVALDVPGVPQAEATAKRLVIARGEQRQLVYYWYQSRGRVISEDWQKIVYVGWDRATRGRTDGSLVRFTIPVVRGDMEQAEEAFRDLAPRVLERLDAYVPV